MNYTLKQPFKILIGLLILSLSSCKTQTTFECTGKVVFFMPTLHDCTNCIAKTSSFTTVIAKNDNVSVLITEMRDVEADYLLNTTYDMNLPDFRIIKDGETIEKINAKSELLPASNRIVIWDCDNQKIIKEKMVKEFNTEQEIIEFISK